jgi:hypothetical protein
MVVRSSRSRPKNAPAGFIIPCRPTVAQRPPQGEGWAHELKHDGYRLQIHVRDGRVRHTGQRRSDLVKMLWSQYDGEFIEVRQQKTDELLSIPCHSHADTILVGERGRPLTAASLKNAGKALAEAGCGEHEIMAILGHHPDGDALHQACEPVRSRRVGN